MKITPILKGINQSLHTLVPVIYATHNFPVWYVPQLVPQSPYFLQCRTIQLGRHNGRVYLIMALPYLCMYASIMHDSNARFYILQIIHRWCIERASGIVTAMRGYIVIQWELPLT